MAFLRTSSGNFFDDEQINFVRRLRLVNQIQQLRTDTIESDDCWFLQEKGTVVCAYDSLKGSQVNPEEKNDTAIITPCVPKYWVHPSKSSTGVNMHSVPVS